MFHRHTNSISTRIFFLCLPIMCSTHSVVLVYSVQALLVTDMAHGVNYMIAGGPVLIVSQKLAVYITHNC